jgi:hypothetical protein
MVRITTIDFPDGNAGSMMDVGGTAMDVNDYVIDRLVRQKLQESRAFAARQALVGLHRVPRPSPRERLGAALIALGERLVGAPAARRPSVAPGPSHG